MAKSALAVAREALAAARPALPAYSHPNSPRRFTQHQLFAILAVREFFHRDYRGIERLLADWSDLHRVLGLKGVPDYSTLWYAQQRVLRKGLSSASRAPRSAGRARWCSWTEVTTPSTRAYWSGRNWVVRASSRPNRAGSPASARRAVADAW